MMSKHIHFIGIGGISMSTLAAIAAREGNLVTGSDRAPSELTETLEKEYGIKIFYPQAAENSAGADLVVYTAAISDDNPELAAARAAGIKCVQRSVYLGQIMKDYPVRIGVSGTHGKSSTTGMLSSIFTVAGRDPTVACGAILPEFGRAYRIGEGEQFIYEACEYKDSFLDFYPSISVILNIEMDHVDYFHTMEQMLSSYVRSAKDAGAVVLNWDDGNVRAVGARLSGAWTVKTGLDREDVDYSAKNVTVERGFASFDLMKESEKLARITLHVPGRHHIRNALCAAAAAHICGLSGEEIAEGLGAFRGIARRFEYKGEYGGCRVFDDYAHHPTEIEATLKTAREMLGEGERLVCVFQPHTYSRTAGLFEQFVPALSVADKLYLAPIYAAREKNTFGISSEDLAARIEGAETYEDFEQIARAAAKFLRKGDILMTMGAGLAYRAGDLLLGEDPKA